MRSTASWLAAVLLAVSGLVGVVSAGAAGAAGAAGQAAVAAQPASAVAAIETAIEKEGLASARAVMEAIDARPDAYAISEQDLNALGYRYLGRGAFPVALAVFEFNVRRFPASDNVYDSLAEAAITAGDETRAEKTLQKWLTVSAGKPQVSARVDELRALERRARSEREHPSKPGQSTGITAPYFGQTPPGTTPILFAPGIVSLAFSGERFLTVSSDGKEIFFEASGRTPGATVAKASGRARFAGNPAILVSRLGPNGWTFPEQAAFTAGYAAREPHVSLDNRRIYWEWLRAVPEGEPDPQELGAGIWTSERTPTGWSQPTFVGQATVVSTSRSGDVVVTDLTEVTQGRGYIARARMDGARFAGFERVKGGPESLRSEKLQYFAHPVVAPDGSYLLFDTGGGPTRACFRKADGTWSEPIDLSRHGLGNASVTSVSPDGKYLFLARGGDIYWVSSQVIEALRPATTGSRQP